MPRDSVKAKARKDRYLERKKVEKYGAASVGVDMRGRHGNHARGPENPRWNHQDRLVTSQGYIAVRVSPDHPRAWGPKRSRQRYAYEHDLVAEKQLGRHLLPNEIVHHKNGDRQDNGPENLSVETRSEHAREHGDAPGARDRLGRFSAGRKRLRDEGAPVIDHLTGQPMRCGIECVLPYGHKGLHDRGEDDEGW